jgi:hypothetical protein
MTTLIQPRLTFKAGVDTLLTTSLSALALLLMLAALLTGLPHPAVNGGDGTPAPTAQAQVAPRAVHQVDPAR